LTRVSSAFINRLINDTFDAWQYRRIRVRFDAHVLLLALTLIALAVMGVGYLSTLKPITLLVNQRPLTILTNQTTVAGVLNDAAIALASEDVIFPALDASVPDNQPISIRRARPIHIQVDGDTIMRRTQSQTIVEALREANILLKPGDRILIDGLSVEPTMPLRATDEPVALQIAIQRAVPIQVDDNGALMTLYTTAPTLGEALRQAGLIVYLGDFVSPDLGTPVEPGWQVYIRRSRAATINVDGKIIRTRTRNDTIASLLAQEGIQLAGKDYTIPAATEGVRDGVNIQVMRVKEDFITESESVQFETVWQADPTMEIDIHQVVQPGVDGVKKRTIRISYENGREMRRSVDREWIDAAPVTQIIGYGTKIVKRQLTLPDGTTATYWRKVRMLATSYTAATSGKPRTHPEFGITYLGMRAGLGIVAVDPRVINLRSQIYVPGYGIGVAGDTGGRIKGRRIDLGYDEANLVLWYKWVDIYLLDPPPPADQIHWVLPDTPRDRTTNNQ
jgi:uncharacterized protein YabE (DUF348 family)